jgi:hypothetical protein
VRVWAGFAHPYKVVAFGRREGVTAFDSLEWGNERFCQLRFKRIAKNMMFLIFLLLLIIFGVL